MDKQQTLEFLKQKGISFELIEHEAVNTVEQAHRLCLPHKEAHAKNLFLRDEKKKKYYLLTLKEERQIDLKEFRKEYGTRPLSFASAEDLMKILRLLPGSVTPLGLINDEQHIVHFFLDRDFLGGLVAAHPMENTATVFLKAEDLVALIRKNGNDVTLLYGTTENCVLN